jgi:hypothetical protein
MRSFAPLSSVLVHWKNFLHRNIGNPVTIPQPSVRKEINGCMYAATAALLDIYLHDSA